MSHQKKALTIVHNFKKLSPDGATHQALRFEVRINFDILSGGGLEDRISNKMFKKLEDRKLQNRISIKIL